MRREKMGFWYRFVVVVLKPLLLLFTERDWHGRDHVPARGGVILAVNHVSHVDPLTFSHFAYECRRLPVFLAKAELFRLPVLGPLLRAVRQVPIYRNSSDAMDSLRDAVAAVRRGECVIIYPEGTISRDPDLWPMAAKTGVARLALRTGCPVIPVAQWGAQEILWPYSKHVRLLPRKTIRVTAGPAVDLSDLGREQTVEVLRLATDRIMAEVRRLLAQVRRQPAPEQVWEPRLGRRVPVGRGERSSA